MYKNLNGLLKSGPGSDSPQEPVCVAISPVGFVRVLRSLRVRRGLVSVGMVRKCIGAAGLWSVPLTNAMA